MLGVEGELYLSNPEQSLEQCQFLWTLVRKAMGCLKCQEDISEDAYWNLAGPGHPGSASPKR